MRGGRLILALTVAGLVLATVTAYTQSPVTEEGVASWYGVQFHGRLTSNGEIYDMNEFTAAHRTLPFGTRLRVTNLANGSQVVVRVNDRGPFVGGRIIDLSRGAATFLDMLSSGTARVRLEILEEPGQKIYVVQLGAFAKPENAQRVQYGLRAAGIEAILERTASRVTRVIVDHVAESDLRSTLDRITGLGFSDYLVRERKPG